MAAISTPLGCRASKTRLTNQTPPRLRSAAKGALASSQWCSVHHRTRTRRRHLRHWLPGVPPLVLEGEAADEAKWDFIIFKRSLPLIRRVDQVPQLE